MTQPTTRTVEISHRDSIPALLGQLCGHAMNRDGKAVAAVLDKIYRALPDGCTKDKPWCPICGRQVELYCVDCHNATTQESPGCTEAHEPTRKMRRAGVPRLDVATSDKDVVVEEVYRAMERARVAMEKP